MNLCPIVHQVSAALSMFSSNLDGDSSNVYSLRLHTGWQFQLEFVVSSNWQTPARLVQVELELYTEKRISGITCAYLNFFWTAPADRDSGLTSCPIRKIFVYSIIDASRLQHRCRLGLGLGRQMLSRTLQIRYLSPDIIRKRWTCMDFTTWSLQ